MCEKMKQILNDIGIPWVYGVWRSEKPLPYIVVWSEAPTNAGADNVVVHTFDNYRLEVYTDNKDFALEEKIRTVLNDAEIYWEKSEDIWIEEYEMFLANYFI